MSRHSQHGPAQEMGNDRHKLETSMRIAAVMAEANERLFKVQSGAANAAFAENSRHLKALFQTLSTRDPSALLEDWTNLYQANVRRVLDVTRRCFEIAPQTQSEIAELAGEPFVSANKEPEQYLDQFTKAIGDSRDAVAASVKDFLTKAIASASSCKQVHKEKLA